MSRTKDLFNSLSPTLLPPSERPRSMLNATRSRKAFYTCICPHHYSLQHSAPEDLSFDASHVLGSGVEYNRNPSQAPRRDVSWEM